MKNFIISSAVIGGIVGAPFLIGSALNSTPTPTTTPISKVHYNKCFINKIEINTVRTCEETINAYNNIFCPALANSWEDVDCEDFNSQSDAQETYENSIICWNTDVNNLDKDNDGIACEPLN